MSTTTTTSAPPHQHGVKGVYYGGEWLDIEDCAGKFVPENCSGCENLSACPRSRTHHVRSKVKDGASYDVVIIGAGCVGAAIARELSKYQNGNGDQLAVLWLEAADDVSQGATKGNSGIVHAGYDDKPGTNRAKYCWKGNQMFADLDKELRFGYQKNGSLVVAFTKEDMKHLEELKKRGETNGVQRLRIVNQGELRKMEPAINPEAIGALYSPDAGNVIPYEFAIALAENAVDNGVELRIRRQVQDIKVLDSASDPNHNFEVRAEYWEPESYIQQVSKTGKKHVVRFGVLAVAIAITVHFLAVRKGMLGEQNDGKIHLVAMVVLWLYAKGSNMLIQTETVTRQTPIPDLVAKAGEPEGKNGKAVSVDDMLVGGSGSHGVMGGRIVAIEIIRCKYIINCAGGASDKVARLIGDASFKIKPRIGDYILLNRNQGHLARHTLFPCPDPKLGKGVLVQTTLWGNLILGPTARDMHEPEARDMSPASVQEYILSKCKHLVPSFDAKETIHAFAGARAKNDTGDWVIGPSKKNGNMIHVAGIDSPGLAGSPAIAVDVILMLEEAGLSLKPNPAFRKDRAPIITPKDGLKGLKMGPVGKFDSEDGLDEKKMAANVICKCERVTELEVVRAMRRSLPIDSSQGIRKRTRAGMGHCQGDPENYGCEARVRAIIARENGVPIGHIGSRPWPATSTLSERWIGDKEKEALAERQRHG